ncbi:alpha/beta hydrolase [Acinetobacter lactucae]|uniref:alpha/beta hydrolase n=1 Tax=Acinetobacter lactucae TaxID=1785128 RepID=UPI0039F72B16
MKLLTGFCSILIFAYCQSVSAETKINSNLESKVFLNYTQEELDRNYTQTVWASNFKQIMERMNYRSEFTIKTLGEPESYQYDKFPTHKIDFYKAENKNAPLMIFIHGGAWKSGRAKEYAYIANPFIANNINVAIIDFDDVIKVGLNGMIEQIRNSIKWIYINSAKLSINKNKIYIVGHSSGAHLGGVLLTTNWEKQNMPKDIIKGAVLISGMYDMKPVRLSARASYVKFDDKTEDEMSTIRYADSINSPILLSYGGLESYEFKRQTEDFAKKLKHEHKKVDLIPQPYFNHFEIIDDFGNPYNALTQQTIQMIKKVN